MAAGRSEHGSSRGASCLPGPFQRGQDCSYPSLWLLGVCSSSLLLFAMVAACFFQLSLLFSSLTSQEWMIISSERPPPQSSVGLLGSRPCGVWAHPKASETENYRLCFLLFLGVLDGFMSIDPHHAQLWWFQCCVPMLALSLCSLSMSPQVG